MMALIWVVSIWLMGMITAYFFHKWFDNDNKRGSDRRGRYED